MKTVVHVYDYLHPHKGGPPQVILNIARAQQARGLKVRLISIDIDEHEVQEFIKSELLVPAQLFALKPKGIRPVFSRAIIRQALQGADAVHLHSIWPSPNLYVAHYCLQYKIPYILSIHGHLRPEALAIKAFKKTLGLRLGFRAMLDGASLFHALNDSEAQDIKNFGLKAPIKVIPNGVRGELFQDEEARSTIEKAIPTLAHHDYLLFLSRIHPPKGATRLAQAFVRLSDRFPNLHLVVAGSDFGGIEEIKAVIDQANLSQNVHFPGFLSGQLKNSALKHALAFCLPSDHEGFSVAVLESLAWGTATVISTACHFNEMQQAQAGWIHDLSVDSLYESLLNVLSDSNNRQETAQKGREWTLKHFDWKQIELQYNEMYESLASFGEPR
ncbi:MAG: glycoside hydrolase [Myxococcales bacterium]|nr:glycoside hydrolase [Myxococcales bacterium]